MANTHKIPTQTINLKHLHLDFNDEILKLYNEAVLNFHLGNFEKAFSLYETRWYPKIIIDGNWPDNVLFNKNIIDNEEQRYNNSYKFLEYKHIPLWKGESLENKKVLIQMEGGMGDYIQFMRFFDVLPKLKVKSFTLLTNHTFVNLTKYNYGNVFETITYRTDLNLTCDFTIGSYSLPYLIIKNNLLNEFPIDKNKIYKSEGYFKQYSLNCCDLGKNSIGVNWAPKITGMYYTKYLEPKKLEILVGSNCYSLNPESNDVFLSLPCDEWKNDWLITTHFMNQLKVIVSVDTATAHMAGALGIPCILLLPKDFLCWRWQNAVWYDSVVAVRHEDYKYVPNILKELQYKNPKEFLGKT